MQSTDQPKIAFLAETFIDWTGGVDFLRLCIGGVDSVLPDRTWPVLVPEATVPLRMLAFAVAKKRWLWSLAGIPPAIDHHGSREQLYDAIISAGCNIRIVGYYGNSKGLCSMLRKLDAQVVLPCYDSLGPAFPVKWVGYYADLQHKRLPEFFSQKERMRRDRHVEKLLAEASAIVVPSKNVVRDIDEFYPGHRASLFALPFCPPANPDFLTELPDDALQGYDLPEKFFLISNQFHIHKSHGTAFAALKLLRDAGYHDVHILCTGNTYDFRAPDHFDRLKEGIARDGLSERVRFLGLVPKRHQLAIMRRAVALLQPTLFEGGPGGLSTFDAVSTATPAIISDIEVNHEVDLGVIEFFRAGSAEDLAGKMAMALKNPPARLSAEATLAMLRQRQQELGELLLQASSFVCGPTAGAARERV